MTKTLETSKLLFTSLPPPPLPLPSFTCQFSMWFTRESICVNTVKHNTHHNVTQCHGCIKLYRNGGSIINITLTCGHCVTFCTIKADNTDYFDLHKKQSIYNYGV